MITIEYNDILKGDISLGVYNFEGSEHDGREFYELVIGLLFFNVCFTFYNSEN